MLRSVSRTAIRIFGFETSSKRLSVSGSRDNDFNFALRSSMIGGSSFTINTGKADNGNTNVAVRQRRQKELLHK